MKVKTILKTLVSEIHTIIHKNDAKVFCISIQRTGTTSVGKFLQDFGYRWAGWDADKKNKWSLSLYNGDYESIFSSSDFIEANAYEDSPWFFPNFYKVLYHRFPNAKFIFFTRDSDSWYKSMVKHSGGDVLGRAKIHSKIYRRELEYFDLLASGEIDEKNENEIDNRKKMKLTNQAEHYKNIYKLHTIEVKNFFNEFAPDSLYIGNLEDPDKWQKLGNFLNIKVSENYDSHENISKIV